MEKLCKSCEKNDQNDLHQTPQIDVNISQLVLPVEPTSTDVSKILKLTPGISLPHVVPEAVEIQPENVATTSFHHYADIRPRSSSSTNASVTYNYSQTSQKESNAAFYLSIIVTIIWILIGSLAFVLKDNYDFSQSIYFVFISTSTIGYGDIIPDGLSSSLLLTVYLFFALSFFSTVISIWQKKIIKKLERAHFCKIIPMMKS